VSIPYFFLCFWFFGLLCLNDPENSANCFLTNKFPFLGAPLLRSSVPVNGLILVGTSIPWRLPPFFVFIVTGRFAFFILLSSTILLWVL